MDTVTVNIDRLARASEVIQGIEESKRDQWNIDHLDLDQPYLLVEVNKHPTSTHWLTTHAMPELAAHHAVNQDDAEDWEPTRLVDLDSGQTYYPSMVLRWDASVLEAA